MNRRVRFGGHPLHPALTDFPIALLPLAFVWYIVALWRGGEFWWQAAFWTVIAGLVAALPTAVTGFLDYLTVKRNGAAFKTATNHMLVMLTAVSLFAGSALVQGGPDAMDGNQALLVVALAASGALLMALGGWLGGELVFRHGVGVEAHDDAEATASEGRPVPEVTVHGD